MYDYLAWSIAVVSFGGFTGYFAAEALVALWFAPFGWPSLKASILCGYVCAYVFVFCVVWRPM